MEDQQFEALKLIRQELWQEVRWRREIEHVVSLGVCGFYSAGFAALVAAHASANSIQVPPLVQCTAAATLVAMTVCTVVFMWMNRAKHHQTARQIVEINDILRLYDEGYYAKDISVLPRAWKTWGQPGTGRWGTICFTVLVVFLALALLILIFTL